MNAEELRTTNRAAIDVAEAIPDLLPLSERSLRRALQADGDLQHLALRVGRRMFIRVEPLRELLGMAPDMAAPEARTSGDADGTVSGGPHDDHTLHAV